MSDAHKGLESICRSLCEADGIQWQEKWKFLTDGFTNLQSDAGIMILERHLEERRFEDAQQETVDLNDTLDNLTNKVKFKFSKDKNNEVNFVQFSSLSVTSKVFLAESRPTKLDNDVFKSFANSQFKAKLHLYRNVYNWYQVNFCFLFRTEDLNFEYF